MENKNRKVFQAVHPDGRKTQFTPEQWDMLGPTKDGWKKESAEPEEVKQLKTAATLSKRIAIVDGYGLEGIFSPAQLQDIPESAWPYVDAVLVTIKDNLPQAVSEGIRRALAGIPSYNEPVNEEPTDNVEVDTTNYNPALTENVTNAAATAVNNQPEPKVFVDTTPAPVQPVEQPAPVITEEGKPVTTTAPTEAQKNKGGRPPKAKDGDKNVENEG